MYRIFSHQLTFMHAILNFKFTNYSLGYVRMLMIYLFFNVNQEIQLLKIKSS